jgi:hypothetical protein
MRAKGTGKRKNALGGPRKSLIRLNSDKIQALSLAGFGWIWLNLAQFGLRLDFPWMLSVTHRRHGPHPEFAADGASAALGLKAPRGARGPSKAHHRHVVFSMNDMQ